MTTKSTRQRSQPPTQHTRQPSMRWPSGTGWDNRRNLVCTGVDCWWSGAVVSRRIGSSRQLRGTSHRASVSARFRAAGAGQVLAERHQSRPRPSPRRRPCIRTTAARSPGGHHAREFPARRAERIGLVGAALTKCETGGCPVGHVMGDMKRPVSPASDSRRCTPGNTSCSSSPLASWECERPPGTPHISHTLAARIQFESRASGRTRLLPPLRRLLEPIDKPLDFRFPQTHPSVFHRGWPKGSLADQAAER